SFLAAVAARGVVSVHECAGPDISSWDDVAALLDKTGPDTPEVVAYWGELASDAVFERAKRLGIRGLAGDLFVDGALGSRTARLRAPYEDDPSHRGRLYVDSDAIAAHLVACTSAGMQAGFHVIGDGALDAVIDGFTRAEAEVGLRALVAGRHRLEHRHAGGLSVGAMERHRMGTAPVGRAVGRPGRHVRAAAGHGTGGRPQPVQQAGRDRCAAGRRIRFAVHSGRPLALGTRGGH